MDLSQEVPDSLVLIGDQPEPLARCRDSGAAAVITCAPRRTTEWDAAMRGCPGLGVLHYSGSLMALASQLPMAIPAARLMQTEGFPRLSPEQAVHEARTVLGTAPHALPVLEEDGSLQRVISRSEVLVSNDETLERPAAELVEKDLKEFSACGASFAVAQIETVDRTRLDAAHLEAFSSALRERCQGGGWDFSVLLVTDIFRGDSIVLSHARNLDHAHALGPSGEVWSSCVSRERQFLPELLRRLHERQSASR